MRRSEKAVTDRAEIDAIIRASEVCRLAMAQDGVPYVVPLNFGYDGESVYFHCAPEGRKLDILRANNRVCLEFDISDGLVRAAGDNGCAWGMRYRSVIAFGTAELVEGLEDRRAALAVVMAQYSKRSFQFPSDMVERTAVIKVQITSITGKRSV